MRANRGIVPLSLAELAELIQLPAGHHVSAAYYDFATQRVALQVEGPKMPEHEQGSVMRSVQLKDLRDGG